MNRERELILVFGQTGMGKTLWAQHALKACHRYVVLGYPMETSPYAGVVTRTEDELRMYLTRHGRSYFRVCHTDPSAFSFLCFAAPVLQSLTLVLEEADRFWIGTKELDPEFNDLIERGRHWRVSLICIVRSPYETNIWVRRQATQIVTFRQGEAQDLDWLRKRGFDPGEVLRLRQHEFVQWDLDRGFLRGRLALTGEPQGQHLRAV